VALMSGRITQQELRRDTFGGSDHPPRAHRCRRLEAVRFPYFFTKRSVYPQHPPPNLLPFLPDPSFPPLTLI